jgi:formyl-CoA transferase
VRQLADWGANVIKIDALMEDAAGEQPDGPRYGSDFQNLHYVIAKRLEDL